jgi:nucleotide-binding universal stress UspA family protein
MRAGEERGMRIVNPSFGITPAGAEQATEGKVDWRNDPIVLFGNSKPNARELLEGVKAQLASIRRVDNIDFVAKNSASQPAPPEMINDAARKYRIALLALGD